MHSRASLGLALVIMGVTAWGIWSALAWPLKAKLFPLVIGVPLFLLATVELLWVVLGQARAEAREAKASSDLAPQVVRRRTLLAAAWAIGFFLVIMLVGFLVAVPLLVFLYLRLQSKESWLFIVSFTAAIWALFYGLFDLLLHLPFPPGWLLSSLGFG